MGSIAPRVVCSTGVAAVIVSFVLSSAAFAQVEVTVPRGQGGAVLRAEGFPVLAGSRNRAVLGITLSEGERRDTAGVRVQSITANGPAAKANLKVDDIITEINGVSLRISAADADDPALVGAPLRRLQRTMAKAKPGEVVRLSIKSGATTKSVSITTVSEAELAGEPVRTAARTRTTANDSRGAIGVTVGGSGTVRDTLGLFVSSVVAGGPAEKAGLVEGERIAAVNGVDVRVPKEDVDDAPAVSARVDRFVREVQKVAVGATITLRVHSGGRSREVNVVTVPASELPTQGLRIGIGDNGLQILRDLPRRSMLNGEPLRFPSEVPRRDSTRAPARVRGWINGEPFEVDGATVEQSMESLRKRMEELSRDLKFELRTSPNGRTPQPTTRRAALTIL